jgi:hypothetical protein
LLDALQFQDDGVLNDKIDAISTIVGDSLVFNWQRNLSLTWDSWEMELVTEAFFIR